MNEECVHCIESNLNLGQKTNYGSIIIYKKNGWFATLSPKTIGDPKKDFTIQLMPLNHLKHISDISKNIDIAKNYGIAFSEIANAMTSLMREEKRGLENTEKVIQIGTYGKSKHVEEHLHIKLFPWKHPYVMDTTYEKKQSYKDEAEVEFVKMPFIKKTKISEERLIHIASNIIKLCKN